LAQAAALTIARVRTVALIGLDVADVDVEVQLSAGLPSFTIVGLADKAVAESRERVRAALAAMGLALPPKRITVNVACVLLSSRAFRPTQKVVAYQLHRA